ncbi:MAG: prolipoprotein diacylglyceryl transferase [Lachnospirales bacterium]
MNNYPIIWFPNLNIELYNISNVAFSILGFDVMWYGIIIAMGVLLGFCLAIWNAKRLNFDTEIFFDFLPMAIIWGIIGARTYYVIFEWEQYQDNLLSMFNIRNGGLAIYGAIISCILYAIYFTKKRNISFFKFADIAIPCLLLGQAIGRYGNFFNREVYGKFTDNIFAMRILLEDASIVNKEIMNNLIDYNGVSYIQVHPTFFYESTLNLCIVIALLIYTKHRKFDGEVFFLGMLGYGIVRFIVEGIRVDQLLIPNTSIAVSQLLGIFIAVMSFICIVIFRKKKTLDSTIIIEETGE